MTADLFDIYVISVWLCWCIVHGSSCNNFKVREMAAVLIG